MSADPICRVVIRDMGASRGPGDIVAVITDAQNIGASTYFNAGGEFHMTLRTDHPQAGQCEPWQTHYSVQEWYRSAWVERYAGIISDFDATENEVIIYGIDYLALLNMVIDTRYVAGSPEAPPPTGSKHVGEDVTSIIKNLVDYARNKADSPVEFIERGTFSSFPERVTIYSTFTAIQSFIDGLVESHRQGTGKRSRFWVNRNSDGSYVWRLADNVGEDKPALRMEYGGLIQGFQVVGFGQFGVKAHGIGRTQTGFELFYKSANAPGMPTSTWGNIEVVDVYDNVADANDLQRRVKQHAARSGKVGKRIALGIRVEALGPFHGYGIGDNLPVKIVRGVIDTTRWGSGYWTVYGIEWRVSGDGHTETSLILTPKEDGVAPNPDLLVDQEVLPAPIETTRIADGAISTSKLADDAVTNPKVATNAIENDQIAPLAVGTTEIQNEAITTALFDPAAVAPAAELADVALVAGLAVAVENDTAEVIIDEDGLTILNGKLTLFGQGGLAVLTEAGFGGAWVDYLEHGTYNGSLGAGTITAITAATVVGTASTPADYEASMSDDIPYWAIDSKTGAGIMARFADATASQGFCLRFSGIVGGRVFQDVPVVPGSAYSIEVGIRHDLSVDPWEYQLNVYYQWRDENHAAIGAEHTDGLVVTEDGKVGYERLLLTYTLANGGRAPANARFVRVKYEIIRNSGSIDVRLGDLVCKETSNYSLLIGLGIGSGMVMRADPDQDFNSFTLNALGVMGWGGGLAAEDVFLYRPVGAAGLMTMVATDEFRLLQDSTGVGDPLLRIRGDSGSVGLAVDQNADVHPRVFLGITPTVPSLEFGDGTNPRDVRLSRTAANRIALDSGDAFDQFLRFVPINRVLVANGATAVSVARTLTAAIAALPAEALVAVGYIDCSANTTPNNSNFAAVFHTQAGTSDFAGIARATAGSGFQTTATFWAGVVHSAGRKLSYQVGRAAGTVTYDIYVTGYLTDKAT